MTGGCISLKQVLPALMSCSQRLRELYGQCFLWRSGQQFVGVSLASIEFLHRRRQLHHRRHGGIPVAAQLGEARHRARSLPAPQGLARRHCGAARSGARAGVDVRSAPVVLPLKIRMHSPIVERLPKLQHPSSTFAPSWDNGWDNGQFRRHKRERT